MPSFDLTIRNGTLVTASETSSGDLGIAGGRIVAVAEHLPAGTRDVDGSGRLVMPGGMTGLELGRKLASEKASLKIVYTSGYSSDLMGKGSVRQSICFLQKPYAAQNLVETVRKALDELAPIEPYVKAPVRQLTTSCSP